MFQLCSNCGKFGHQTAVCWEREDNRNQRPNWYKTTNERAKENYEERGASAIDGNNVELLLYSAGAKEKHAVSDPNIWIADTAATVHMTPHKAGITNLRKATHLDTITMGNGTSETATAIGDVHGEIREQNGKRIKAIISNVTLLPSGKYNLFSVTQMLKKGWKLTGNADELALTNGTQIIKFDIKIHTPRGILFAMHFARNEEMGAIAKDAKSTTKISIQKAHEQLGHISYDAVRKTAKHMNWELTGKTMPCEACAIGKAKQKNIPKTSAHIKANDPGERMFLDLTSVKEQGGTKMTKPWWRIMVDERTQLKFSAFFGTKTGFVESTCETFQKWKEQGHMVSYVRCDNGTENKALENWMNGVSWKLNVTMEYTGRDTPQRNHLAELGFAVLANRGRAVLAKANIPKDIRYLLWREAFMTVTLLDGLVVTTIGNKTQTRFEHWGGTNPPFAKHLRTWGEAGTVKLKNKMTPKLDDRGKTCMMVGYALQHAGDTYRMWDPNTRLVHVTRDIIWLNKMFYEQTTTKTIEATRNTEVDNEYEITIETTNTKNMKNNTTTQTNEYENITVEEGTNTMAHIINATTAELEVQPNDDISLLSDDINNNQQKAQTEWTEVEPTRTRSGRKVNTPVRLIKEMNAIGAENYYFPLTENDDETESHDEYGMVGAGLGGGFGSTTELHVMKYKAAMKTADSNKWKVAVEEEHARMIKHGVWIPVTKTSIDNNAKVLTTTWAMKKKSNGKFRARLNARGYEQIDGIHYDEDTKAAPVTNETTIKIILILMAMTGWYAHVLDVQGAFLNGRFEEGETLYLNVPEGFEDHYDSSMVLKLKRTIYGLKQAAFAFWKELLQAFGSMNFQRSEADPCLYFKWEKPGIVIWLSWVDDCLIVGHKEQVIHHRNEMMDRFDCDNVGPMREYVGCKIERDVQNRKVKIKQPVCFEDEFDI